MFTVYLTDKNKPELKGVTRHPATEAALLEEAAAAAAYSMDISAWETENGTTRHVVADFIRDQVTYGDWFPQPVELQSA